MIIVLGFDKSSLQLKNSNVKADIDNIFVSVQKQTIHNYYSVPPLWSIKLQTIYSFLDKIHHVWRQYSVCISIIFKGNSKNPQYFTVDIKITQEQLFTQLKKKKY